MYVPPAFSLDLGELAPLLAAWPFATVVSAGSLGLFASHVPLVVHEGRLVGHLARANPQVADLDGPLLAIFHGPHAMVRSDWYRTPTTQVPTWNYLAIHANGVGRPFDAEAAVRLAMSALQPDTAADARPSAERVASLARGVVGFAIEVERWEGKAKLSQNRDPEDQARVAARLADTEIGPWMRRACRPGPGA